MSTEDRRATVTPGKGTVGSSRDSLAGTGWRCKVAAVVPSGGRPFSWINPVPVWHTRNQYLKPILGDPTNHERRRWMKIQRETVGLPEDLILDEHASLDEVSFLVVGDTGEGDASQYAVVKPLLACGRDTDFMVVCSDVIYPAGDADDYEAKLYTPYED